MNCICLSHVFTNINFFFILMMYLGSRCSTKRIFKSCAAVCFDVDSTVIREEGVDVLASMAVGMKLQVRVAGTGI